jgi:hypothetical protein
MVNKISKIVSWVLYALMAVSVVLAILFYTGGIDSATLMMWGYVLLVLGVLVAIISPVYGFILNPGNVVKLLVSLGLVALIAIISYSLAGNTFSELRLETLKINAQTSKMVGMGLLFTYITSALAIVAILYSSIFKIFK